MASSLMTVLTKSSSLGGAFRLANSSFGMNNGRNLKKVGLLPSSSAAACQSTTRSSSSAVTTLSDADAVEKFRILHHKSILYFTATWCPPCKVIAPIYEDLSKKYTEVAFGKVDVDENSDAALDFEVSAVPTFVMFEGEHATEKWAGADEEKLERHVKYLNNVEL